uniref:Uncharacterized protein n=1 Tax=Tetradesmus obliquus TaxID=3088 RepID=A0A383V3H4_TETOB
MSQQQSLQGQRPVTQQSGSHVVAHTHSYTFMHSQKQTHTHRTTLMKSWVPGQDGPAAAINTEGLCDELNMRLLNIDQTLQGLLAANSPQQQQETAAAPAGVRHKLENSALHQQLAFSTALLLDWCGAAPAGRAEPVLQQLVQ